MMGAMKKVAKLLIIDADDKYLMMYRSDHPELGADPDLPGGTLEEGESLVEGMRREVREETGLTVDKHVVDKVYNGSEYSAHGTQYTLFTVKFKQRPEIVISWEHSAYEWIERDDFLKKARAAKDTYMHMAFDVLVGQNR